MHLIIYNDYKNEDWLKFNNDAHLQLGTIILINNQPYNAEVCSHLRAHGMRPRYVQKLVDQDSCLTQYLATDAENYRFPRFSLRYGYPLGKAAAPGARILFPENLGGPKYEGYDEFIKAAQPNIICMERTYNVWKPWELLKFWLRNKYLRDRNIETYIGIWPESLPKICQWIQYWSARIISNGHIFWYSETKSLPRYY